MRGADARAFPAGVRPAFHFPAVWALSASTRLQWMPPGGRMKAKDALRPAQDPGAVMVDLKFMDFVGLWQHFTIPLAELKEEIFEEGLGFDGSSIRGWAEIHASDRLVMAGRSTARW